MGLTHGCSANLQTTIDSRAFMLCYVNKLITPNFIVLHARVRAAGNLECNNCWELRDS